MNTRLFGRTGLKVSEVGFGGGGIGNVWGETTETEGVSAVHRALELGVNFFDVAPGYGDAEKVLGKALHGHRDEAIITTKVSHSMDIRESIERSLRNLQTDRIDLILIHNWITSKPGHPFRNGITADQAGDVAELIDRERDSGKVRFIGFTAWRCNEFQLLKMMDSGIYDAIQTEYNILNQTACVRPSPATQAVEIEALESGSELDLHPRKYSYIPVDQHLSMAMAAERNMGVIGIRTLLAGVLSSGLDREVEEWTQVKVMQERAEKLAFLATQDRSLADAAFTFALMQPFISTIVPGVKSAREIEQAVARSGAAPLKPSEMEKIRELNRNNFTATANSTSQTGEVD